MAMEHRTSYESDPLNAFAGLFLLPREISNPSEASRASQLNDLQSIHLVMKSAGLRNAEKLIEESKAIVDNGSEQLLTAYYPHFISHLGLDDHVDRKGEKDKALELRPNLGRKRSGFSMKPYGSQPTVITLGPKVDLDQITDPEEYFLAFKKLENAQQEINRQLGVVDNHSNTNILLTNSRHPQQPLHSRRKAKFKHIHPIVRFDDIDTVIPSKDIRELDDVCSPKSDSQLENNTHDAELRESELAGVITEEENRLNYAMDRLLSHNLEEFQGDRVFSLLQEELQLKPLDSSALLISHPTTSTEINKIKKNSDVSLLDNQAYRCTETNAHSDSIDTGHCESPDWTVGDDEVHTDEGYIAMRGMELFNESHGSMGQHNEGNHVDIQTNDGKLSTQYKDSDGQVCGSDCIDKDECTHVQDLPLSQVQEEADDTTNASYAIETNNQSFMYCQLDEHAKDFPSAYSSEQIHSADDAYISENCTGVQNPSNQSKFVAAEGHMMDMRSAVTDTNPRQHIMKHRATEQTRKNNPFRGRRETRSLKSRPSVADGGTMFEGGVRRSKRIKSRPLDFWKGEKLLFGRVNESVKLIGVKYESPTSGNMKVKSYVSDKYKEVLELAARD
ncbi:unnamed protein product [Cuscuta epithymum]|uniref:Centromere protein C n=1 Tax=Cuscuta epithymum TaxID=186058 RepID=A0AAV0C5P8_9ASTE|nr:unnamed protein product [Cuscuta epithymum]